MHQSAGKKTREESVFLARRLVDGIKKSRQRIFFFLQSEERLFLRSELFTKAPLNV